MRVECDLTIDDIVAGATHFYTKVPFLKKRMATARIAIPVAIAAIILFGGAIVSRSAGDFLVHTITLSILVGPVAAGYWAFYPTMVRSQQRKIVRQLYTSEPCVKTLGQRTYELSSDGILDAGPDSLRQTRWAQVVAVDEGRDHGFVTIAVSSLPVPRRSFASPDDFAKFMAAARAYFERSRIAGV